METNNAPHRIGRAKESRGLTGRPVGTGLSFAGWLLSLGVTHQRQDGPGQTASSVLAEAVTARQAASARH